MSINMELDHTYLVRFGSGDTLSSITILMITNKGYHIRWNRGTNSSDTWELRKRFDMYYFIEEDITDFIKQGNCK